MIPLSTLQTAVWTNYRDPPLLVPSWLISYRGVRIQHSGICNDLTISSGQGPRVVSWRWIQAFGT